MEHTLTISLPDKGQMECGRALTCAKRLPKRPLVRVFPRLLGSDYFSPAGKPAIRILTVLFLCFFLISCTNRQAVSRHDPSVTAAASGNPLEVPKNTATTFPASLTATEAPTPTPEATETAAATPTPPQPTLTDTPVPLLNPCIALETLPRPDAQGVAVLGLAGNQFEFFLQDLQGSTKTLLGEGFYSSAVSPDYRKLAYIDTIRKELIVVNADGDQLQRLPAFPGWYVAMQWLPNDNILLEKTRWGSSGEDKFNTSSALVVNLATHEQMEYVPENYPSILAGIARGFDPCGGASILY